MINSKYISRNHLYTYFELFVQQQQTCRERNSISLTMSDYKRCYRKRKSSVMCCCPLCHASPLCGHLTSGTHHRSDFLLSSSLLFTLVFLLYRTPVVESAPLAKIQIGTGANNGKILIWPDEIDDNALTENDGDFIYKQNEAEKQTSVTPANRDPTVSIHWPSVLAPAGKSKSSSNHRGIGRLSRNSAAAPAPGVAPGGSTVYLWPSFSPSSSSSSTSVYLQGWLLAPINICLMFTWLAWIHLMDWYPSLVSR